MRSLGSDYSRPVGRLFVPGLFRSGGECETLKSGLETRLDVHLGP